MSCPMGPDVLNMRRKIATVTTDDPSRIRMLNARRTAISTRAVVRDGGKARARENTIAQSH